MRAYRGTLSGPGKNSPYRDRSVEENLDLFERMKNGEFPDGSRTLRAKIDMSYAQYKYAGSVLYRIAHASHHTTGNKWCIYPMYDFAHPLEDAIEGITHSICTMEFEDHRPLYDWVVDNSGLPAKTSPNRICAPWTYKHGYEQNANSALVEDGLVDGWTIRGCRRYAGFAAWA